MGNNKGRQGMNWQLEQRTKGGKDASAIGPNEPDGVDAWLGCTLGLKEDELGLGLKFCLLEADGVELA
jgi:hypothetical protein